MRMNELSQVGQVIPSDLILIWASDNGQSRTAPMHLVSDAVQKLVLDGLKMPGGLVGIGAAEAGFNNSITGLGGIKSSRALTNMNNASATGWYVTTANASNLPAAEPHLLWHQQGSNTQIAQMAISLDTGKMATRKAAVAIGGDVLLWSNWKGQVQEGDITAANLPLSTALGKALMQVVDAPAARSLLGMTTLGQNLVLSTTTASAQATLGATVTGQNLFTAATTAAARLVLMTAFGASLVTQADGNSALTTLGVTARGRDLIQQSTIELQRSVLGSTAVGDALFIAADSAAARNAIGATAIGNGVLTATTNIIAQTAIGATVVGRGVFSAASAADAQTALDIAAPSTVKKGVFLQMPRLANLAAAPTAADFNNLLSALITAGNMAAA